MSTVVHSYVQYLCVFVGVIHVHSERMPVDSARVKRTELESENLMTVSGYDAKRRLHTKRSADNRQTMSLIVIDIFAI